MTRLVANKSGSERERKYFPHGTCNLACAILVLSLNCLERVTSTSVWARLKGLRLVVLFVPIPQLILSQKSRGAISNSFVPRRLWAVITRRVAE